MANPGLAALTGPDGHRAERRGRVLRYAGGDVCPFLGWPDDPDERDWADLAALLGPGGQAGFAAVDVAPPPGWEVAFRIRGVQMLGDGVAGAPAPEAVPLGAADVPEMLDLVERTRPGPFLERTVELGGYLGIRRGGALVAMAGERLHLPGWTEISAVCTDPAFRGQGLAGRLVAAVAAGIRARGGRPMLHAAGDNTGAIRLYESMGFRLHRTVYFTGLIVPDAVAAPAREQSREPAEATA
ncbi:GNAT family N-acetyltransferase [Streptomyces sp. SL13]|uniref:GNAT family N-acetyltransferase n=1 Tax=Streptantibioticus silvisoli TaxID=2705255 RepID=A0AA90JZS6_9ACTN|nr:GNAT family N-acetyltransferase [Streptantibioticus silvisoli]MDI5972341.1 GNAT family N-acetyltransferase [Streptantibioticus silvisoli]